MGKPLENKVALFWETTFNGKPVTWVRIKGEKAATRYMDDIEAEAEYREKGCEIERCEKTIFKRGEFVYRR